VELEPDFLSLKTIYADNPYITSTPADTSNGCSVGDHDGGSAASMV
jgi:hypothetical protein